MPYVVRIDGKYLVRSSNTKEGGRERKLVVDVDEATTWTQPSHARNAVREAWNAKAIPVDAFAEIVLVALAVVGLALTVKKGKSKGGAVTTVEVP